MTVDGKVSKGNYGIGHITDCAKKTTPGVAHGIQWKGGDCFEKRGIAVSKGEN